VRAMNSPIIEVTMSFPLVSGGRSGCAVRGLVVVLAGSGFDTAAWDHGRMRSQGSGSVE
jgi:hypothetical protein